MIKKMKALTGVLLLSVLVCGTAAAQKGFLGKRTVFTFGVSPGLPMMNGFFSQTYSPGMQEVAVFYEKSYLPPKLMLQAGHTLGGHVLLSVEGYWQGLQNSGFHASEYQYEGDISVATIDSFRMRTDVIGAGLEFKFFSEFAPIGRYITLGANFAHAMSDVYPTYQTTTTNYNTNQTTLARSKKEPGVALFNIVGATFGFGRTRMLNKTLVLDYGARTSIFIKKRSVNSKSGSSGFDYDYKDNIDAIFSTVAAGNIQSTNAIELYVKFGITY